MARVLVIDDNPELLRMIQMLLEKQGGHEVTLCTEGREGLASAATNPPDLAIVDVMMPEMTGYEVCRRLRAATATANIPIIILTARGQEVDRKTALEAGATLHITKPVRMMELLETANELLTEAEERSTKIGVMGFLSLRGGVGVTTLAVNWAATLACQAELRVCLVDLCPSSGNVALQLRLRPNPSWSTPALMGRSPDPETISDHLLSHSSGLRLLAAPFVPITGDGLPSEIVLTILSTLRRDFDAVVVDLPTMLNGMTMTALEAANVLCLVLTPDPASIQATVGTLQALKSWRDRIHLILNHVNPTTQSNPKALARVLRHPLTGVIPFDAAQAKALSRGQPLALRAPDSPLTQAVTGLLTALKPAAVQRLGA
ncbi:MAG: response regulator [Anaerolineae bacterium]|jgi:pilus assembly protein CpaE